MSVLRRLTEASRQGEWVRRMGEVRNVSGTVIVSEGPDVVLGEMCRILPRGGGAGVMAEVVGLRPGHVTLMPYGSIHGLSPGSEVLAQGEVASIPVGPALVGRVLDCFGRALDGRPDPAAHVEQPLRAETINPMQRPRIDTILETGVRIIDALLTLGRGQRVGIFAGSGVGKSTLLGMVTRQVRADVNVIALIGERGREVREFIEQHLDKEGLARSVVVVATSDQPAPARLRAAHAALAIAEYFRAQGQQVLLTMDSITRYAMARREIGLAAGEPPTVRGYTPSVFADIPMLCERCGTHPSGGSITALLTVLVEGDDHNEPVADLLRATLDGHIVLNRALAHRGQYPAIDVLQSASRLLGELVATDVQGQVLETQKTLSMLERNRQVIEMGAYTPGVNAELDRALRREPALLSFLSQRQGGVARAESLRQLTLALGDGNTSK